MTKLSVIINNNTDNLEKQIENINSQSITDIELIFIVNSTQSLDTIRKHYPHESVSILYESINREKTRNNALNISGGEYVTFVDENTTLTSETALEDIIQFVTEYKSDIVCPKIKGWDDSKKEYFINRPIYTNVYYKRFLEENNVEFDNLRIHADSIFTAKLLKSGAKIAFLDETLYQYDNVKKSPYESIYERKDYIRQYSETLKILSEKNLKKEEEYYKNKIVGYLLEDNNINNTQLQENIAESGLINFFSRDDYGYPVISYVTSPPVIDDDYRLIKECIFEENMIEDKFISTDELIGLIDIRKEDSESFEKNSFSKIKEIKSYTSEDKKVFQNQYDKIKNIYDHNIDTYNAIINSNSWKIAKIVRKLLNKSENKFVYHKKEENSTQKLISKPDDMINRKLNRIITEYDENLIDKKEYSMIKKELTEYLTNDDIQSLTHNNRKFLEKIIITENLEELHILKDIAEDKKEISNLIIKEEELKKETQKIMNINESLFSTRSWKYTKFLRIKELLNN